MSKPTLPALSNIVALLVNGYDKPRVYEEGGIRCLRFGNGVAQSEMRLAAPLELALSYTRLMLGFVLFNAAPEHILLVGLGGGSLSKYCYQQFPHARITTLEINPDVIALREQFLIPADDARFQVIQADASDYLARHDVLADVILLDAYDATGLPECICSTAFYSDCWRALSDRGVLVANLWRDVPALEIYLTRLRGIFDGRVWWSRPHDTNNLIVFNVKNAQYFPQWSRLLATAHTLGERYHVDLTKVVNDMRERPELGDPPLSL
jgi:spermidine synthase